MIRYRRNSQKPDEQMISHFKERYLLDGHRDTIMAAAFADHAIAPGSLFPDDSRNTDATPRVGVREQFTMSPSMMDPNSEAFTSMANQPPSYLTAPSPGTNTNTAFAAVTQSSEMNTPGMQMTAFTPLAISHATSSNGTTAMANGVAMDINMFNSNPQFHGLAQGQDFGNQHIYAPPSFIHKEPEYDMLDSQGMESQPSLAGSFDGSLDGSLNGNLNGIRLSHSSASLVSDHASTSKFDSFVDESKEKFRFHATLRAATAMVKNKGEIPTTYLNKGQVYSLIIADSEPFRSGTRPVEYRTFVRVSFEDDEQRSKPAACWQLWKEGRGANEAHHRNGKLVAVEHVDPNQGGDGEQRHSQIHLEQAGFDGFAVTWTPNRLNGNPEVAISVRFNFLSTDFSHSKGVKGIPVRLCAKTEVLSTSNGELSIGDGPEVAYCKVKLFRDHGAERKLSNDVAHVKKLIEKHKQQLVQPEISVIGVEKRKRSSSISGKPSKALKHKSAWSVGDARPATHEEEVQMKLNNLQEMFSSTRPVSILDLRGDPQDDPDLYPVQFGTSEDSNHGSSRSKSNGGSVISPAMSHDSLATSQSPEFNRPNSKSSTQYDTSRHQSLDFSASQQNSDNSYPGTKLLSHPVKIQRASGSGPNSGSGEGWFEAMDVDSEYKPPAEAQRRPKCCFYVRPQAASAKKNNGYYRAIYLSERTSEDLKHAVARKCHFEPSKIAHIVRVCGGIEVMLDTDDVREIPEGQDMIVEFTEIHEENVSPTAVPRLEMRLIF